MHRQRSCPVVALPNSNMVKCPSPRRLFVMTAALLSGILLATITHDEDRLQLNGTDETAPFKVPGPDSICPADSPTGDGLITFIESSGEECLTPRQACGIESAARANPRMDVRVHTNAVRMGPPGWDHRVMRPGKVRSCAFNRILADLHPNVRFIREDFSRWLEEEDSSFRPHLERMKSSPYWVVQLSDVIRLILLKKHGGFYLDFDNIVFRPIHCLRNSVSYLEEAVHIENGIMVRAFLARYFMASIVTLIQLGDGLGAPLPDVPPPLLVPSLRSVRSDLFGPVVLRQGLSDLLPDDGGASQGRDVSVPGQLDCEPNPSGCFLPNPAQPERLLLLIQPGWLRQPTHGTGLYDPRLPIQLGHQSVPELPLCPTSPSVLPVRLELGRVFPRHSFRILNPRSKKKKEEEL